MLTHAPEVNIESTLVITERFVTLSVCFDPIAYVLPQFEVVRWTAVQLIGQGAKQAIAVTERWSRIQT